MSALHFMLNIPNSRHSILAKVKFKFKKLECFLMNSSFYQISMFKFEGRPLKEKWLRKHQMTENKELRPIWNTGFSRKATSYFLMFNLSWLLRCLRKQKTYSCNQSHVGSFGLVKCFKMADLKESSLPFSK